MAHTARSEDDKKEFFDTPEILEQKVTQLAEWIKQSNHLICFTVSIYNNHSVNHMIILL